MLISSSCYILYSNAVSWKREKSISFSRVGIYVLLCSSIIGLWSLYISCLFRGLGLFGGLFHASSITHTFQIFIFIVGAAILQLTAFYPRRVWLKEYSSISNIIRIKYNNSMDNIFNKEGEQFKIVEYTLVLLFVITGAVFLISASDLVSIFLSIELQSYGLYLLCTIYRNSELATNAGLTYFLLGGLSSCFILLGTSLLYSNSGTTNMDGLYIITSLSDVAVDNYNYVFKADYIHMSLLILSIGFLFKVSAAPFHFWSPAVYDAIPTIVTTFVAIVAKISIFIFLLELVYYTSSSLSTIQFSWTTSLLVSSLLSLIVGSVLGLTQSRIKRLFAYSTISHVGFILLALSINSIESIQAFIFYLIQYSLSNLNAFFILLSIGYVLYYFVNDNKEHKELIDKNNSPIQLVTQIKGLFYIYPVLALSLAITIFSFAGIPPLIGFFAKQMVISAALDNGYIFITLIAILTSVISAVYYLNIINQMFFGKPEYTVNPVIKDITMYASIDKTSSTNKVSTFIQSKEISYKYNNIILASYLTITISVLTLVILLFIFMPQEWLSIANILALIIFNP